MRSSHQPTNEELTRLESLVGRFESRGYFFDRLENPEWVIPLAERGFFSDPPVARPGSEPGSILFPPWPEGRYLVRMAPHVPDAVASILKNQPTSDNPAVTRLCLKAAGVLPKDHLRQVAHKVVDWIKAPHVEQFAEEAASVISQLLKGGRANHANSAARVLLALKQKPDQVASAAEEAGLDPRRKVMGRISDWEYQRVIVNLLPVFVDEAGLEGVKLFAGLLGRALQIQRRKGEPDDSDGRSTMWRPAIEDHSQNHRQGIRNVLVSATRDAAMRFAKVGGQEMTEVVLYLERGSVLHRRIALHLVASVSQGTGLASERITDRGIFDDHRLRHEYAALVRGRFGEVPTEAQRTYLEWVTEGPDLEEDRRRRVELGEPPPSDEEEAAYKGGWQRDRLSFAASHLDGEDAQWYRQLVAEFGEPEHADFVAYMSSWEGPQSPISKEEMSSWSAAEILDRLRTWRPDERPPWSRGPSMAGFGRVFRDVVQESVSEFVPYSTVIGSLDPTYVRSFLEALSEVSKRGDAFSWAEPLGLMASVVGHPSETSDQVSRWDRDYDWRPSRHALAWLLHSGFSSSDGRIPFDLREAAWRVLEPLTDDPDPSAVDEASRAGDGMDPDHWSINSVRGIALHAVIRYALWCHRELGARGIDTRAGFELMPEVRVILERHLDPQLEPTLTIRSVYGRWLPWLHLLDQDWVVGNLALIFPRDPVLAALRDVAWSTYIGWCPAYNSVFPSLRSEYEAAVDRVPSGGRFDISGERDIDEKLGEHLVVLYWRRVAPGSLVDRFFQQAADDQAGAVMEYVGRALLQSEEEVADPVCERIQELWSRRLDVITADPGQHRREAQAFSITFAAAQLDTQWELDHFERVLHTHPGSTAYTRRVIERLAYLAEDDPVTATRLTLTLLKGADNEWNYLHWRKHVRSVLVAARDNAPHETAENRQEIIDHYVSRGEFDFRDLL